MNVFTREVSNVTRSSHAGKLNIPLVRNKECRKTKNRKKCKEFRKVVAR